MRKRFEQQLTIGQKLIADTFITTKSRDPYIPIMRALKEIFITPELHDKIFDVLEEKILKGKKPTGRWGMDLWLIFVLAQVRFGLNISYDRLHTMSNQDTLLRQIMGIETESGFEKQYFEYQQILDNIQLLDEKTMKKINDIIYEKGYDLFKKKEVESLRLKTDSFVLESNVHFPTDYNLLWDSGRKCLDIIGYFIKQYPEIEGWRKLKNWYQELKNKMRSLGRASASGGKGKEERQKKAAQQYLDKAKAFSEKLTKSTHDFPINNNKNLAKIIELEMYKQLFDKHINLVEQRLIKKEIIPHEEKMFSIFEPYTEWITKGKLRPSVELGKKVNITSDQYHLVVDYQIMDHEADSESVIPLADRIIQQYKVKSWSFDKGYYKKENKELLKLYIPQLVMPKKGKKNQEEKKEESQRNFIRLRKKHSAIESGINELEHRGLDRCPDRGEQHFLRYVALGVCAYNLRRIGAFLLEQDRQAALQERSAKMCA
jgi:IS5 family transposase